MKVYFNQICTYINGFHFWSSNFSKWGIKLKVLSSSKNDVENVRLISRINLWPNVLSFLQEIHEISIFYDRKPNYRHIGIFRYLFQNFHKVINSHRCYFFTVLYCHRFWLNFVEEKPLYHCRDRIGISLMQK